MITSKSNPKIKEIRLLKQAKHRNTRGEYFIEGVRLVEEALRQALPVRKVVYSPRLEEAQRGAALLLLCRKKISRAEWLYVSEEVMGSISDTTRHQGILVVLGKREYGWEELGKSGGMVLLLCELQDPGNLGTIFRAAEAGGVAGLVLTKGSIDPYSPKVARASMGSIFRIPFLTNQDIHDCLKTVRSLGYKIWAATGHGGVSFWEADLAQPSAVILGQEGAGIPKDLIGAADGLLTIPMTPSTESLNVAMAAGLVIYEGIRQKRVRSNERNVKSGF
jgi:TrmH family RNA methyltransferase